MNSDSSACSLLLLQSSAIYLTMLFPLPCNTVPLVLSSDVLQRSLATHIVCSREFTQVFKLVNPLFHHDCHILFHQSLWSQLKSYIPLWCFSLYLPSIMIHFAYQILNCPSALNLQSKSLYSDFIRILPLIPADASDTRYHSCNTWL